MGSEKGDKPKAKAKARPRIVRPLGYLERYELAMLTLGYYRNSILTCRYLIPAALLPLSPAPSSTSEPGSKTAGPAEPDTLSPIRLAFERALARVVLAHPFLRVGLRGEDRRKPDWVALETVDFRRHVEWRLPTATTTTATAADGKVAAVDAEVWPDAEVWATVREHLDVRCDGGEDAPSWKVTVFVTRGAQEGEQGVGGRLDVLFEWGHAHTDGISAKILHEDLLRHLNEHINDSGAAGRLPEFADRVLTVPPSAPTLLPSLHTLCRFPVSAGYALATLWRELRPTPLTSYVATQARWSPIRLQPYATEYRQFALDAAPLAAVLRRCRAHQTTLTGLLQTLIAVAFARRIPAADAPALSGGTILNLRPIMAKDEGARKVLRELREKGEVDGEVDLARAMANYVTSLHHEFGAELVAAIRAHATSAGADTANEPKEHNGGENGGASSTAAIIALEKLVWQTAERVRTEIQGKLDQGFRNDLLGLVWAVSDYRTLFTDIAKKPRSSSFAITNLGVIDGSPAGPAASAEGEGGGNWRIDRAVFSISPQSTGSVFTLCPVAVKGGQLWVSCNWQACAMDKALGDAVMADIETWLRHFGREAEEREEAA
ncbi:hypothetical protein GGS23DRAFT_438082 [Durotheca rogersii]|uniref:uncharacterized protein n=1 Tax=Durotheca rogersii TaxID=419775 RepID=UPI00222042B7|nr:uncharacterized protein GGS23DRAFT_438082 [Durotheca rogersii]KAI5856148.1 hypothetical protein GGS23DRAFT_438082 [Durotheca rogersii]